MTAAAARSSGSATIAFGLVSIVVKIYSAHDSTADVSFNNLHKGCGSRIKQQTTCPVHNKVLSSDEITKGYEYQKDLYVEVTPEEIKALQAVNDGVIDITEFVPASTIAPQYHDSLKYLGPDKGGDRAYSLLVAALMQTKLVAIGKHTQRGKQYLVAIAPHNYRLVMQVLKYDHEVRAIEGVPLPKAQITDEEIALGVQLVKAKAREHFEPELYEDEVRTRVLAMLDAKAKGTPISVPAPVAETPVIDLMAALRASLGGDEPKKAKPAAKAQAKKGRRTA